MQARTRRTVGLWLGSLAALAGCTYDLHVGATAGDSGPRDDVGTLVGEPTTTEWIDLVGGDRVHVGESVLFADLDGDGLDDIVLGDRENTRTEGVDRHGSLFVVYGRTARLTTDLPLAGADARILGPTHQGSDLVLGRGDFDGDGIDDVLWISSGVAGGLGTLHVLYGSPTRFSGTVAVEDVAASLETAGGFGYLGASVGDVDDDGFDDIVARGGDVLDARAFLVRGSATRFTGTSVAPVARTFETTAPYFVGFAAAGDLDGDGIDDLLVSDVEGTRQGRVGIFYGPLASASTLTVDDADARIHATFDIVPAMGDLDVDGDGYDDLVVMNDDGPPGALHVFRGRATRLSGDHLASEADVVLVNEPHGWENQRMSSGDVDGDGRDDLLFSSPGFGVLDPTYERRAGRVYRVYGMVAAGSLASADEAWLGRSFDVLQAPGGRIETHYESLGAAVAQDGDFDGDGHADALMGGGYYSGASLTATEGHTVRLVYGAAR